MWPVRTAGRSDHRQHHQCGRQGTGHGPGFNVLTDVFAISGDSNTWAVWGERDCELAILMIPARLRSCVESTGLVLDPDDDFIGDLTLIGYPRFLPDEFADELRANMRKLAAHSG